MSRLHARKPRRVHRFQPRFAALEDRLLLSADGGRSPNSDVLTSRNDALRTGDQSHETALTPQDVNPTGFGLLNRVALDGYTYAQPLYLSNVCINGQSHDVVYAATEHDSVYAIDANSGSVLWHTSYIDPTNGVTPVPGGATSVVGTSDIVPEIGITGTPVIDTGLGARQGPGQGGTMFFITKTQEIVGGVAHYVQRLHAVDITTGQDVRPPATLGDTVLNSTTPAPGVYTNTTSISVPGDSQGSVNGVIQFNALRENDRAGMALSNGVVYATFASHGDNNPYNGWVVGYDEKTLQLVNVWNDTPFTAPGPGLFDTDGRGGIWQSGSPPAIDSNGNLILSTGNGAFGAYASPPPGPTDLGQTGGGLGYAGIPDSIAVKFDAYKPSGNHSSTGLYVDGHYPDVPPNLQPGDVYNDLAGTGIDFNAAAQASAPDTFQATLAYDGTTLTETITDQTTGASVNFSYAVNIPQQTAGNTAWVGFGGGTGGLNSFQNLLSWTYSTGGSTVIDHSAGFASHSDLTNNGSATYNGAVAQLTTGQNGQAGSLFETNQVNVASFTTTFTFQMAAGSNPIADGMTFIIQAAPGHAFSPSYGESVIKLTPAAASPSGPGTSTVADFFTPFEWNQLNQNDTDLGSGATMVLPDQPGSHPHLAVETGKSGKIYVLDLDNMGKVNPNGTGPDFAYQVAKLGNQGVWGSPAYYSALLPDGTVGNFIYYQGSGDVMKMIRLVQVPDPNNPGQVETQLQTDGQGNVVFYSESSDTFNFPGGQPSISSDDNSQGIVWAVQDDRYATNLPEVLHAYDALDLSKELYRSDLFTSSNLGTGYGGPNTRDQMAGAVKFVVPTIAGGHVFVGGEGELDIFGLYPHNTAAPAAAPSNITATLPPRGPQVQLSWTNNATNATAIQVLRSNDNVTFTPIATVAGDATSFTDTVPTASTLFYYQLVAVNQVGMTAPSTTISVRSNAALPVVTVRDVGPAFISLSWTSAASDPTSTYTVERSSDNGTTWSALVTGLSATTTSYTDSTAVQGPTYLYRVTAVNPNDQGVSDPVQAKIGPVTIDHSAGFVTTADVQANGSALFSPTEQLVRLTNNYNQAGSLFSTEKLGTRGFTTEFTFRLHEGTQDIGIADGLTFVIQSDPRGPSALGPNGGQLGYQGITSSIAIKFDVFQNGGEPSASTTGLYLNGASPQGGGSDTLQYGINLRDQHTKQVILSYDDSTKTLTETLTDISDPSMPSHVFTYSVDIPGTVGDAGYAGFTGAGGATDYTLMDMLSWSYNEQDGGLAAPRTPSNLHVTTATDTSVTLGWLSNNAYTATGYSIERSASPQFTDGGTVVGTVGPNVNTFTDTNVPAGTYYYRIRAFTGSPPVYSRYSNVSGGITLPLLTTIDHSAGFASNSDLQANGSATYVGTVAQLTPASNSQAGSIFTTTPLDISHFTTSFTFQMQAGSNPIADGLTFTIQGNSPTALGAGGGGLGYAGIANSIAIKFDAYKPSGNHSSTGLYVDGHNPDVPPNLQPGDVYHDLAGTGIDFNAAAQASPPHTFQAALAYDGTTLTETVTDQVTNATVTFSYPLNLPSVLGGTSIAYVGFTGGTGGSNATEQVLTWTFSNTTVGPTTANGPLAASARTSAITVQPPPSGAGTTAAFIQPPANAAGGTTSSDATPVATVDPAATDPSAGAGPPAAAPANPQLADKGSDNSGNTRQLQVRQKVKKVDTYLDELAAALN